MASPLHLEEAYPDDFYPDEIPNFSNGESVLHPKEVIPLFQSEIPNEQLAIDNIDRQVAAIRADLAFTRNERMAEEKRESLAAILIHAAQIKRGGFEGLASHYAALEQQHMGQLGSVAVASQVEGFNAGSPSPIMDPQMPMPAVTRIGRGVA